MIRRPPRSTQSRSSAASDVYKRQLFGDPELMDAIVNTISIAFISTAVSTILGTVFAIGINSLDRKRKQRLIFLNNVPIINADIVTGVFLMLVFLTFGRLIGVNYPLGYTTMLIAHIFFSIPYVILSILPKLNEMDPNLYDAALDLGSKPSEAVMKIIVPTIKPGIITGMLIAFTMSIDDFIISYFTTGCLLYTSDAADDLLCVDLGGRRIIKKKQIHTRVL